ncbi:ATPase subunit of ABC transporter with duplicated ATPase domains [Motilibacter rhizosphaerae]|uniref:ATPase subunit of ABC transporter with duplicated ATPase domains n=1 Tax=Motilibacter rhizosphaerae TaxID=598652 RepID=A0A4Q7NGF3_9ACTN|nr:ATP-binding cassette domain-containing protein [Motilibacter rhizosphaerae]RZS82991.1 ATPase subunit of ABC transporter with duplicated ATPase domains [Motilibacter rhizosphaerae]
MGYLDVSHVAYALPDGRPLFDDVSFRVADGAKTALVGANGTGKTTLLRIIAGDLAPIAGSAVCQGGLGVMRQFIGSVRDDTDVRGLLLSVSPPALREAGERLDATELAMMERDDEPTQLRYAQALADWGDAGGYDAEVLWDVCTTAALGMPFTSCGHRLVATLSGGEQKRLVLEALLRGPEEVLLLDEPDNYLDVPGKRWLEQALRDSPKTVLFVSHDRELLHASATRVVTIEAHGAWVHGGGFTTYAEARQARRERLEELHKRWDEEHERLRQLVFRLREQARISPDMASRYSAMQTRLEKFEAAGRPPEQVVDQKVTMRLRGGRTGTRAVMAEGLELTGLMQPFDAEVFFGERVAVLGSNGSGKSHFLRLLGGQPVAHTGSLRLGARVVPGLFAQTHAHPELVGRTLVDVLHRGEGDRAGLDLRASMSVLRRYGLQQQAEQAFDALSGGQQARFQVLLLELSGCTLLLLDEPTDNLDLESAEALEEGLEGFEGTVVAVTHDRWFARGFDRYLVFGSDGRVYEAPEPVWDETRVQRAR